VAAILQITHNNQLKVGVDDGGGVGEDAWLGGGTWRRSAIAEEQMGGSVLQLLDGGK
jgi:hypothetical protein